MGHVLSTGTHGDAGLKIAQDSPNDREELSSWAAGFLCAPGHMSSSG